MIGIGTAQAFYISDHPRGPRQDDGCCWGGQSFISLPVVFIRPFRRQRMEAWKRRFWVFGFPPILWMLIIAGLSSIPGQYLPRSYWAHQAAHWVEYTVFGVLLARALAHLNIKLNVWTLSLLSVVLIVLFACFDEWRQSFVPGRHAQIETVFFDAAYAVLGVFFYDDVILLRKHQEGPRKKGGQASS